MIKYKETTWTIVLRLMRTLQCTILKNELDCLREKCEILFGNGHYRNRESSSLTLLWMKIWIGWYSVDLGCSTVWGFTARRSFSIKSWNEVEQVP